VGAQDRKAARLLEEALPVLRTAQPLLADAARRQPELRGMERRADRLVRAATPLARESAPLLDDARPLVADLRSAGAPRAIADTGRLARSLNRQGQLLPLIAGAGRLARRAEAADVVGLAQEGVRLGREARRIGLVLADVQRRTLDVQGQTLAVQRETLAVQREALARLRSIDERTGGVVTPP
jgi:hypothetical protein